VDSEPPVCKHRLMRTRVLVASLLLLGAACGAYFVSRPQQFIVPVVPGLIFPVRDLPEGAASATVVFRTNRPPAYVPDPSDKVHWIWAWANEGGNVIDGSAARADTGPPQPEQFTYRWTGTLGWPPQSGFDTVGVVLEPGVPYEAFRGPPLGSGYCTETPGPGIECNGDWALGGLTGEYDCLGAIGEQIDCGGTGYHLLPAISVYGLGVNRILDEVTMAGESDSDTKFKTTPDVPPLPEEATFFYVMSYVQILQAADGWRYRSLQGNVRVTHDSPSVGPFATARDVAEAAVADLGLQEGIWVDHMLMQTRTDHPVGRAMAELIIAVRPEDPGRVDAVRQLEAELAALDP
jgi:hypothetical protein